MSVAIINLGDSMTGAVKCIQAAKTLLQSIHAKEICDLKSVSEFVQKSALCLQSSAAIIKKHIQIDPTTGEDTMEMRWSDNETSSESDTPLNIFLDDLKSDQCIDFNSVADQHGAGMALMEAFECEDDQTEGMKSLLFFGPESVEKIPLIRSYALGYEWNCLTITPSMILDPWIGKSVHLLEEYFEYAVLHKPCVIILSELDRLVGKTGTGNSEENVALIKRTLRVQMAKALENHKVVVIGCTANPSALDGALLTRFDKKIFHMLPSSITERMMILNKLISKFSSNITCNDIEKLAQITDRFSESDMSNLIKHAYMMCIRKSDIAPDLDICNIILDKNCLMEAAMNCRPGITNEEFMMFQYFNASHADGESPKVNDWTTVEENEAGRFSWLWNLVNPRFWLE